MNPEEMPPRGGFWRRLGALVVDGLLFLPLQIMLVFFVIFGEMSGSAWLVVLAVLGLSQFGWVYSTIAHGKFGCTVGKYAMGLRVVSARDFSPIGFREAVLRDAPTIAFALLPWALLLVLLAVRTGTSAALPGSAGGAFGMLGARAAQDGAESTTRVVNGLLQVLAWGWFVADVIVMLASSRRRALHDFVAGTAVIRVNANRTTIGQARYEGPPPSWTVPSEKWF